MTTKLEKALGDVINVYHKHATKRPNPDDNLQKHEFKQLMKAEAKSFLESTLPPTMTLDEYIEDLFQKADKNKNKFLHFEEFVTTLATLAIHAHDKTHEPLGQGHGHGHGPH